MGECNYLWTLWVVLYFNGILNTKVLQEFYKEPPRILYPDSPIIIWMRLLSLSLST